MLPIHREDDDSSRKRHNISRRFGLLSRQLLTQARSLPRGLLALLIASSLALGFLIVYVVPRAISEHGQLSAALEQWREWDLPADTIPVLIPTYSRPAYLASVIESLRNANNVDKVRATSGYVLCSIPTASLAASRLMSCLPAYIAACRQCSCFLRMAPCRL